ncbi:putative serine carboxypeptidase CPVL-like protein [Dinothrombium tinctorium]|uniref:Putative serine carboxypeptidase CPVL-like protein n=1 Tax=Dinothrombium tinctorium TaxID=1965070 RepID=A0A3S3PL48_9ACAR|nr:putative serine carboxypeptidase CPVL-like protein [Dinothrombium tinctorium]RWS01437.1 putative serine carboxypeptidase CPVL-like protein [Dinothrombium tinctorium]RWS03574.1 putative serine carboxypeptidase CPVL-like protein [Dinothrombium tinctorium]
MATFSRFCVLYLLITYAQSFTFRNLFSSSIPETESGGDCGEPLFLTPLIENGEIELAKQKSLVHDIFNHTEFDSYSGFLTVNKSFNSNLFFIFFKSRKQNAPLLLWLQGGPGASSLFGLFVENGPFKVNKDLTLSKRRYAWTNEYSMLYIDNPVGTGFSFTKNDAGYARDQIDVARDLYNALQQFFTLFSELRSNDFYATGESYAGKYVPAIAYKIHKERKTANISLKGIAIGNGLCDPETQIDYGDFLYQVGLIDESQRQQFIRAQNKIIKYIKSGRYIDAYYIRDSLLNGFFTSPTLFFNATGLNFYYNIMLTNRPQSFEYYQQYLALPKVRKMLHVGNLTFNKNQIVRSHLLNDLMKSVKPLISVLMDNYKTLFYNGQLDVIDTAVLTENFLRTVQWKYRDEYLTAKRRIWKVDSSDEEVAGYVRKVHNFYQVVVRRAGHMLPYDQPRVAFDLITRFVHGTL